MKRSDHKHSPHALLLALYLLAVLMLPNVALTFTEGMSWQANAVNLLLPAGVYLLLISLSRITGRTVWLFFPIIFFSAFQIVLLYLFGRSIIAVDMFLNVVTSNTSEMCELLGDMWVILLVVVLVYIPLLVWGAVAWRRRVSMMPEVAHCLRLVGLVLGCAGLIAGYAAWDSGHRSGILGAPRYSPLTQLFPVNVTNNLVMAVERSIKTSRYHDTSAEFTFNARSSRPDTIPELYIIVVGETSRAENWQLGGYSRHTNPKLSKRDDICFYTKAMSESNTTHKSVPMLLSGVDATRYDSLYCRKGIITAFKEAGYHTCYFSSQARNGQFIEFIGEEADRVEFVKDTLAVGAHFYDMQLLEPVRKEICQHAGEKEFVVIHTYGSHFKYGDRYPDSCRCFMPDSPLFTDRRHRDRLMNAYDNSIVYTDALLDAVIEIASEAHCPAAVVYVSDHGEDIFDDARDRFLHSSPTPTVHQLHVPMVIWTSRSWRELNPLSHKMCQNHCNAQVSTGRSLFHTMLDIAGIQTPAFRADQSLANPAYSEPRRYYLTDHNIPVDYRTAGMEEPDFMQLRALGIH